MLSVFYSSNTFLSLNILFSGSLATLTQVPSIPGPLAVLNFSVLSVLFPIPPLIGRFCVVFFQLRQVWNFPEGTL